jgi:hypothetical protein
MSLYKLLLHNPLLACSVCLCLLSIAAAIRLVRKLRGGPERFIAGFVGLVAIYEGLRILVQAGIWRPPESLGWADFATFIVTGLFVLVLIVVQEIGTEGHRTRFLLRLFEADRPADQSPKEQVVPEESVANLTSKVPPAKTDVLVVGGAAGATAL